MKIKKITIEWTPTTPQDEELLSLSGPKTVTFEDNKGWLFNGPVFPSELTLIQGISAWLKEHWKQNKD